MAIKIFKTKTSITKRLKELGIIRRTLPGRPITSISGIRLPRLTFPEIMVEIDAAISKDLAQQKVLQELQNLIENNKDKEKIAKQVSQGVSDCMSERAYLLDFYQVECGGHIKGSDKNGKIDGRKKIVTKAGSVGVVFESVKKKDNELAPFIEDYLNEKNIKIERKATLMIADHIGADLNRIASELDKLIVSLKEEQTVTPEIVESQIGISKDYNIFELKSAIINRNIFKAYQIMKYFDKNPKSGSLFGMLPQLFAYFQNLMIAYYVPKNNDEQELARYFGFSYTWQARDYIIGMRNYSGVKTMQIISKIREIDAKSKGLDNPNTSAGELMKELFYFILH